MKNLFSLTLAALILNGCALYTPAGSVVVDPKRNVGPAPGNRHFCPPGQAKKGNC